MPHRSSSARRRSLSARRPLVVRVHQIRREVGRQVGRDAHGCRLLLQLPERPQNSCLVAQSPNNRATILLPLLLCIYTIVA